MGSQTAIDSREHQANWPTWEAKYAQHGGSKPETFEGIPTSALVVKQDASRVTMSFSEAWSRSHDKNTANDVWVVGVK